jgi:hypothetical protein
MSTIIRANASDDIWSFAHELDERGYGRNISFSKSITFPNSGRERENVQVFKHRSGRGRVVVWPHGGDDLNNLAYDYGLSEMHDLSPKPRECLAPR